MFRKSFSRNQHDSSVTPAGMDRADARHAIHNDVAKRCNIVMGFLRTECAHWRKEGFSLHYQASKTKTSTIVRFMKGVDPSYTRLDVTYVLAKLKREGFLGKDGAYYFLRHDPREVSIRFK